MRIVTVGQFAKTDDKDVQCPFAIEIIPRIIAIVNHVLQLRNKGYHYKLRDKSMKKSLQLHRRMEACQSLKFTMK